MKQADIRRMVTRPGRGIIAATGLAIVVVTGLASLVINVTKVVTTVHLGTMIAITVRPENMDQQDVLGVV